MTRHPLHVETDSLDRLAAVVAAIEALGVAVSCPAHDARMRLRSRDEYLRQALELMSGTLSARCRELAVQIARFEANWPRWHDEEAPPERFSAVGRCLFQARKLAPLPGARQLWNIAMKRRGPGNFTEKPVYFSLRPPE